MTTHTNEDRDACQPTTFEYGRTPSNAGAVQQRGGASGWRVVDIYRRLGWTRQQVEQVVRMERDTLARWGMRLHTATASEGFGRKERYITVDGTRYSALSLDTHGRAWPDGMDG